MKTIKTRYLCGIVLVCALSAVYFVTTKKDITTPQDQFSQSDIKPAYIKTSVTNSTSGMEDKEIKQPTLVFPIITFDGYKSIHGPLPKSLRGTSIPASFELDAEGHLIITASIKELIEYFLSATGEEPIERIIERIEEFLTQQLEEPARTEALNVLGEYIAYKESLLESEQNLAENLALSGKGNDYLLMFKYRREARMNNLTQTVYDAFFGDEDKTDSYTAALIEIRHNDSLTDEEKATQFIAMEQLLPLEEQAVKRAERTREKLKQELQTAREEGASEEQIYQMRAGVYGYEAADRFAAADEKKTKWNLRFEHYREQRKSILISDGLSDTDRDSAIYTLQTELFSAPELRRLSTLDRMADSKVQL